MKNILAMLALAVLLLGAAAGLADGEGTIEKTSCSIMRSGEYYLVYTFAQVHNNSDTIICLDQGAFELHNSDQMLASQSVSRMWPMFLNPGEDGYFFDVVTFGPTEDGPAEMPVVTAVDYNIVYMPVNEAFASRDLSAVSEIVPKADGSLDVICEISNTTDIDAYDAGVAFGLFTQDDQMIYADGTILSGVGVPAGGTTLVRFTVEEDFVAQWSGYGVAPVEARVSATFHQGDD